MTRETPPPPGLTFVSFSRTSPLILPLSSQRLASPYYCRHFTLSAALFSYVIPLLLLDQGCHSLLPSLTWVPSLLLFDILSSCRLAPSPSHLPVILPLLMSSPVSPFSQSLSSLFVLYCASFSDSRWKTRALPRGRRQIVCYISDSPAALIYLKLHCYSCSQFQLRPISPFRTLIASR